MSDSALATNEHVLEVLVSSSKLYRDDWNASDHEISLTWKSVVSDMLDGYYLLCNLGSVGYDIIPVVLAKSSILNGKDS